MSRKRLGILAVLAVIVIGVLVVSGGSGSSSGWSSDDVATAESKIADHLTAEGVTPTKAITECVVKGVEPIGSFSEAFAGTPSQEQVENTEQVLSDCISDPTGAFDELYSGSACSDNLASGDCIAEVESKLHEAGEAAKAEEAEAEAQESPYSEEEYSYGEEEYPEDEYETENEGLNEMNQELQEEYGE